MMPEARPPCKDYANYGGGAQDGFDKTNERYYQEEEEEV